MGRYNGTLHKLVDSACSGNSKTTWNQVLHYLECHTVGNATAANPKFDSPLPPYTSPSVELELELFDQQGPKREESPLRIAIKSAPSHIVAALCHLGPEAAQIADSRDRLPLHWACRRSSENPETERVLSVLIRCHPSGLVHRDDGGRTPLHWLFWYHAPTRSSHIVEEFSLRLPVSDFESLTQVPFASGEGLPLPEIPLPDESTEIPASALIVHDARHGALPLHYAVVQGATKQVIDYMVAAYPLSKAVGDRRGRTPLAWYLGAGHLMENKKHVCGESSDPNALPWWYGKLSHNVVQVLLSSKVARICDDTGRYPIHWACHLFAMSWYCGNHGCVPLKVLQLLEDHYIQALTLADTFGKTPLQICFDVVGEQQELESRRYVANQTLRDNVDLVNGGPAAFKPPLRLIELLLKSPEADGQEHAPFRFDAREDRSTSAAFCEDRNGALALHSALRVAASPEVIKLLIQAHPTSLVHTTEERLQTPLICGLCSPHSAPLQHVEVIDLMMAAYVTSRHGTFMDGRLALKMEDASGKYPIHYCAQNQSSLEVLRLLVNKFPRSVLFQNSDGDLPVHCLLSQSHLFEPPDCGFVADGASLAQPVGFLSEEELRWQEKKRMVNQEKIRVLIEPLMSEEHLRIGSSAHGMTPLHIAVAFDAMPYPALLRMLQIYPDAARRTTTAKGYEFSCLDLHELNRSECKDKERWDAIQELLFSFNPTLDTYRRREALLEACVNLIRSEVKGFVSFHMKQERDVRMTPSNVAIRETLSTIEVPQIDCAFRPQRRSKGSVTRERKQNPKPTPMRYSATTEKTIYDDDLGGRYVVSSENSEEGSEDSFSTSVDKFSSCGRGLDLDSALPASGTNDVMPSCETHITHVSKSMSRRSSRESLDSVQSFLDLSSPSLRCSNERQGIKSEGDGKEDAGKECTLPCKLDDSLPILSEVALRVWCFFVLFNDPRNPEDSYVKQVEAVLSGLDFELVERLINISVPSFALQYVGSGTNVDGATLRDFASPRPMAFIRSSFYFVGRYDFCDVGTGVLFRSSGADAVVLIRGTEHLLSTEEYNAAVPLGPGIAEEAIWSYGEAIPEEHGFIASKFGHKSRSVTFKFTRSERAYCNEILCRSDLGIPLLDEGSKRVFNPPVVVPLIENFDSFGSETRDKRFKLDVSDPRFESVALRSGGSICLSSYPYALVFPYLEDTNLFECFYFRGIGMERAVEIAAQVGYSLAEIHKRGVVHGSVNMQNVLFFPTGEDSDRPLWALTNFSNAYRVHSGTEYVGMVCNFDSIEIASASLPPEMFLSLTEAEAATCNSYWDFVESQFTVPVDTSVLRPHRLTETSKAVVFRCHFVSRDGGSVPSLPYKLLPARETLDIWSFGTMLFSLCSDGRPLFAVNPKTGHLMEYDTIVKWDEQIACRLVYEHVKDTLAQDVLLSLLSSYERRSGLTIESVLSHPFFDKTASSPSSIQMVVDRGTQSRMAFERCLQQMLAKQSEEEWLAERTVEINCWNFDILRRFHFSVSEILSRRILGKKSDVCGMPCCFILLPYKLCSKNKKSKLAPSTKKDVERAERMGVVLLSLSKACHFAVQVKRVVEREETNAWSAGRLLELLALSSDFDVVKSDLMKLAAENVEMFRVDPTHIARMMVVKRIIELKACFEEAKQGFVYLVDEYGGVPLAGQTLGPYPLDVPDTIINQVLLKALPFMHIASLYVRGVTKSVAGLVRLIFEAAYPHIPPSWGHASAGLTHSLNEDAIFEETSALQDAIASMGSGDNVDAAQDFLFLRGYILKFDAEKSFAKLRRVVCGGCSLWTTSDGEADIRECSRSYGFKEALEIQGALEKNLRLQEEKIRRLRDDLERMTFRSDLGLVEVARSMDLPTEKS